MKKLYILTLLILAAYLVLFPQPLNQSLSLHREWVADLSADSDSMETATGSGELIKSKNYISVLTAEGGSKMIEPVRYDAVVFPEKYINYDSVSQMLLVNDQRGMFYSKLDTRGYPFRVGRKLFVLSTDKGSMKEWTLEGEPLKAYSFPSILTSIDTADDYTLTGFLDGTLRLYDSPFGIDFSPAPSRYHVIYGVAAAERKNMFAAVMGLTPQYLAVYGLSPEEKLYRQIELFELQSDFRHPVYIDFFGDDVYLAIQSNEGITVYNTDKWSKDIQIQLEGFSSMLFDQCQSLFLFTDKNGNCSIVSPFSSYKINANLGSEAAFRLVSLNGGGYILLYNDTAYRFTFSGRGEENE